jgi:hypothetical protein
MKNKLYVINLALRYKDGDKFKVENDTLFSEELPTEETAKEMAIKYSCDVLINVIGIMNLWGDEKQKANSFVAYLPEAKEVEENGI